MRKEVPYKRYALEKRGLLKKILASRGINNQESCIGMMRQQPRMIFFQTIGFYYRKRQPFYLIFRFKKLLVSYYGHGPTPTECPAFLDYIPHCRRLSLIVNRDAIYDVPNMSFKGFSIHY